MIALPNAGATHCESDQDKPGASSLAIRAVQRCDAAISSCTRRSGTRATRDEPDPTGEARCPDDCTKRVPASGPVQPRGVRGNHDNSLHRASLGCKGHSIAPLLDPLPFPLSRPTARFDSLGRDAAPLAKGEGQGLRPLHPARSGSPHRCGGGKLALIDPSHCRLPLRVAQPANFWSVSQEAFLFVFPLFVMKTKTLRKGFAAAYEAPPNYPRRKPYTVSPVFDVVVILFGIVSAVGYFLT